MATNQGDAWRARAWEAHPEVLAMGATQDGHRRSVLRVGAVVGADLGVPHPWGIQITAGDSVPLPDDAQAALAWCEDRGRSTGWRVSVPERLADAPPWSALTRRDSTGLFATDARTAAALRPDLPAGVDLVLDASRAQVISAYGGWMSDLPLAELLVRPDDMTRIDRRFVVACVEKRPVGCAFIWWASGTGYLSGIGVVPDVRGRGIGRALTAAAARIAADGPDGDAPDVVWMHATDEGAALYARMGFELVDTEVLLGKDRARRADPAGDRGGALGACVGRDLARGGAFRAARDEAR